MPYNSYTDENYEITSEGTNDQGNHYDHRVSEDGDHSYHYSNQDGSYYYQNSDGSTHYDDGDGYSRHTSSDGDVTETFTDSKSDSK